MAAGWTVATLYRRRIEALMRGAPPPDPAGQPPAPFRRVPLPRPAAALDLAANRRARLRLLLTLAGACLLIGVSQAWLTLRFMFEVEDVTPGRFLPLAVLYCWPIVLACGLVLRWSWPRVVAGVTAYIALAGMLIMLRSTAQQDVLAVVSWIAIQVGAPVLVILLIGASSRIRATAPSLLPLAIILAFASILGLLALDYWTRVGTGWSVLAIAIGVLPTQLLFALAPWIVVAWPAFALGRRIAHAYRRKRFSDHSYSFGAYWLIILILNVLPGYQSMAP